MIKQLIAVLLFVFVISGSNPTAVLVSNASTPIHESSAMDMMISPIISAADMSAYGTLDMMWMNALALYNAQYSAHDPTSSAPANKRNRCSGFN